MNGKKAKLLRRTGQVDRNFKDQYKSLNWVAKTTLSDVYKLINTGTVKQEPKEIPTGSPGLNHKQRRVMDKVKMRNIALIKKFRKMGIPIKGDLLEFAESLSKESA